MIKITLQAEYDFGDMVYIKSDPDQVARQVIHYQVTPSQLVMYEVQCAEKSSVHYDFELTSEKKISY